MIHCVFVETLDFIKASSENQTSKESTLMPLFQAALKALLGPKAENVANILIAVKNPHSKGIMF